MKIKKLAGRGAAYTVSEKRFLVNNVRVIKPVLEGGWEKVHGMHISMYSHKNKTVDSSRCCFMTLYQMKCPSGDPGMATEVCNAKMAWLHILAKIRCATGSSDNETDQSDSDDDVVETQELLEGESMAQSMPSTMTTKKVIELDNESVSGSDTDMSAFENPFKRAKNVSSPPKITSSSFSLSSSVNTVERKKVIMQAKKTLEGKTISYSCLYKKPTKMENSMFFIMQQQMKQRKDNKVAREQQLILDQIEQEATER
eukprot:15366446-Ditylum_brightwellii.AAC.1